jgi:hypothetical protein
MSYRVSELCGGTLNDTANCKKLISKLSDILKKAIKRPDVSRDTGLAAE